MSAVSIRSMWFRDALQDPRLQKAIRRLRLKNGDFQYREDSFRRGSREKTRMFYVEGPRGGIHGILLANPIHTTIVNVGVYIDRKSRRKKFATSLVEAASTHYPSRVLKGLAWNETSLQFWNKVQPLTRRPPAKTF